MASYEILTPIDREEILKNIELAGRTCYRSFDRITEGSASKFVRKLVGLQHESVLEHQSLTVKFICDRGIMAELTRHRLASFSVESTRYCNYSSDKFGNELTVIDPMFNNWSKHHMWKEACKVAEIHYFGLLEMGVAPEMARSVLPSSTKTEVVMTANMREWRTVLKQRTSLAAHPQMRELMVPLLAELHSLLPELFDDIMRIK